jgi:hypothetical protein
MATNENVNTWGNKTNTNLELLSASIAGHATVNIAGSGTYTLTVANGATDEARMAFLTLTGALTGNRTVIVPDLAKTYVIRRNTTGNFTVTVKTALGAGVQIPSGATVQVACNGSTVFAVGDAVERVPLTGNVALTGTLQLASAVTVSTLAAAAQGYVNNALTYYAPLSGASFSGNIEVSAASVTFSLNRPNTGGSCTLRGRTNNLNRWTIDLGDQATESGSNVGSYLVVRRYGDNGTSLGAVMTARRDNGLVSFANNVVATGSMTAASFITASDEKLKRDLIPLKGVLEDVQNIETCRFSWSDEAKAAGKGEAQELGVLAQQLIKHFPELVHQDEEMSRKLDKPVLGVDYSKLGVLAIAAIKELSEKVDRLERQLNST